MIVGVRVRGHKSFYAYDLVGTIEKNQCKKWSNKSLPESKLQEKNVSFLRWISNKTVNICGA